MATIKQCDICFKTTIKCDRFYCLKIEFDGRGTEVDICHKCTEIVHITMDTFLENLFKELRTKCTTPKG